LRWGIFATVLQALALLAGLPFGPIGVATAYVLITFALFVPALAYAGQPLGIKARDVVRTVGPQMCSAVLAAGISFACRFFVFSGMTPIPRLVLLVATYVSAYLVLAVGIFRLRTPLRVVMSLLADFLPARFAPFIPFGIVRGTKL
jgi:PST family polysaccharide transporter